MSAAEESRERYNPSELTEDTFRALLRQRIDDWYWSTSSTYAGPEGSETWRDGLAGYLVQSYTWPRIDRALSQADEQP